MPKKKRRAWESWGFYRVMMVGGQRVDIEAVFDCYNLHNFTLVSFERTKRRAVFDTAFKRSRL